MKETMLHAYTKALDWLKWGNKWDEDSAEATLAVIAFQKEEIRRLSGLLDLTLTEREEK